MSWQAVHWWLHHATVKGAAWQVGIVLATHADEAGTNAYPSKARLAVEAELHPETVSDALNALHKEGLWVRETDLSPLGTRIWTLQMDDEKFPAKHLPGTKGRGQEPPGSETPRGQEPPGSEEGGGRGRGPQTPGVDDPPKPSREPSRESHPSARRARTATPHDDLAERITGVLQRGIDGLTTNEPCRPPTRTAIQRLLDQHDVDSETALVLAIETRSIAQSQNRAPNITGLFAQMLRQAASSQLEEAA